MEKNIEQDKTIENKQQPQSSGHVPDVPKKRKLVIPGDELGTGHAGHGTYEEDDKVFSKVVGLHDQKDNMHFVIPLKGIYNPKRGDGIIAQVMDIAISRWIMDINSPYDASMSLSDAVEEFVDLTKTDLTRYFTYGDLVFAEVSVVSKSKSINLSMRNRKCRKLRGGRIVKVTPSKVPRIIGRNGSMVELIKNKTDSQIVVGQNGIVWIKGGLQELSVEAILEIEEKAQMDGLTDAMSKFLDKRLKELGVEPKQVQKNAPVTSTQASSYTEPTVNTQETTSSDIEDISEQQIESRSRRNR